MELEEKENYFHSKVNPICTSLITSILEEKPEDIKEYSRKWFKKQLKKPNDSDE